MSNPNELPYTDADILELVGLAQRMREIKHWEMQAGSKILAEIVGRMHAGLSRRAQPEGEAPQAESVLPEGFTLAPVQMPEKMRTYLQDRLHHPICKAEIVWKQLLKMGLDMEDE